MVWGMAWLMPEHVPLTGGSCTFNLWGTMLLWDPMQFIPGPQGTWFPCVAMRRHCTGSWLWRGYVPEGVTYELLDPFSLTSSYPVVVAESRLKKHYFYANTLNASHNPVSTHQHTIYHQYIINIYINITGGTYVSEILSHFISELQ